MPPVIDKDKCNGCTKCTNICCMDVYGPSVKNKIPEIRYAEECWHCNACVLDCPKDAITLRYPLPMMMLKMDSVQK